MPAAPQSTLSKRADYMNKRLATGTPIDLKVRGPTRFTHLKNAHYRLFAKVSRPAQHAS